MIRRRRANSAEKLKIGKYEVPKAELAQCGSRSRRTIFARRPCRRRQRHTSQAAGRSQAARRPDLYVRSERSQPRRGAKFGARQGLSQDGILARLSEFTPSMLPASRRPRGTIAAEIAKAGVNAPQRVDAVGKWITGEMGEADAGRSAPPSSPTRIFAFTKR